jgi:hypothetical protein
MLALEERVRALEQERPAPGSGGEPRDSPESPGAR